MPSFRPIRQNSLCATLVLGILTTVCPVRATTVVDMNIYGIAELAGQVVSGRVVAVRSYWATHPTRIESEVTMDQVEYIKGGPSSATTTFVFTAPGGTIGNTQMRIAGAPEFHRGERWFLCLLPGYKTYPVVGISRGAFQIRAENGVDRVYSTRAKPIIGIDPLGFVRTAGSRRPRVSARLVDSASVRVISEEGTGVAPTAMSYDDFIAQVRPIMAASRQHATKGSAGRHIAVRYLPVPLADHDGAVGVTTGRRSRGGKR